MAVVANLYMEWFEQEALSSYCDTAPKVWFRYVDDMFVIISSEDFDNFFNHINSIDSNIKFTYEKEQDNKLPFLDTLVHREDTGALKLTVYRKPTHTDQYLDFESHHPVQ